jgi:hypothetical protein
MRSGEAALAAQPAELVFLQLAHCGRAELLALRRCCRRLAALASSPALWRDVAIRVGDGGEPDPASPMAYRRAWEEAPYADRFFGAPPFVDLDLCPVVAGLRRLKDGDASGERRLPPLHALAGRRATTLEWTGNWRSYRAPDVTPLASQWLMRGGLPVETGCLAVTLAGLHLPDPSALGACRDVALVDISGLRTLRGLGACHSVALVNTCRPYGTTVTQYAPDLAPLGTCHTVVILRLNVPERPDALARCHSVRLESSHHTTPYLEAAALGGCHTVDLHNCANRDADGLQRCAGLAACHTVLLRAGVPGDLAALAGCSRVVLRCPVQLERLRCLESCDDVWAVDERGRVRRMCDGAWSRRGDALPEVVTPGARW